MAPEKQTPEDKLLNIIEYPSSVKGNRFNVNKPAKDKFKEMQAVVLSFRKGNFFIKLFTLQNLNRIVVGTGLVLAGFLVFDFQYQKVEATKRLLDMQPSQQEIDRWVKIKPALSATLKESLNEARRRNIFVLTAPGLVSRGVTIKEDAWIVEATDAFSRLSLVGVLREAGAQQVMIEDTQKGKTHFLGVGDVIDIFEVKSIKEDSVILKKNDKEWTLR